MNESGLKFKKSTHIGFPSYKLPEST